MLNTITVPKLLLRMQTLASLYEGIKGNKLKMLKFI